MKNPMFKTLCLLLALALLPAIAVGESTIAPERQQELHQQALTLTGHLEAGEEEQVLAMMDDTMRQALTGQVAGMWATLTGLGGDYLGDGAWRVSHKAGYDVVEMTLKFSRMNLMQTTSFDADGMVAGLFIKPGEVPDADVPLPDGVTEQPITVDAGTGWPLEGVLTLPKGAPIAGVVLVHGSGPSNRDEAIGANTPFRDLAYGLSARGIAVLRYDKRTFTHGGRMAAAEDFPRLTVDEETVQDAVAALNLLKGREELSGKPVYLLGHSMGAMLASYIGASGGEPAGYILLAGTPRQLWEMSAEQNLQVAEDLAQAGETTQADQIRAFVDAELPRAQALKDLTDEQALAEGSQVFGMSAWYLRHMAGIDAAALHLLDQKPVLVLQGESDRQVTMADFALWQDALKDHPDARFISYPGLNHLFGAYQGPQVPMSQLVTVEYAQRTPVSSQVVKDIADWMTQKAR